MKNKNNDLHFESPSQIPAQEDLLISPTKILAIGHLTTIGKTSGEWHSVMLEEVPATVRLYLDGKIESWFIKTDKTGVVFLMNVVKTDEANVLLESLPMGKHSMMTFELIPLGPFSPLRFLLNTPSIHLFTNAL